jgi:predicted dehydrogenase
VTESPVKLAIAGGHRGASFNYSLESLSDRVTLAAVCDVSEDVLAAWRRDHQGVATFTSYDRLLDESDCDAVLLATPWPLHASQAIQALRAGRHVLSEVIAAASLDECWQLIETVEATGRVYMMSENYCYTRPNMMVLNMVRQGLFGEPVYAEGGYIHDTRDLMFDRNGKLTWRGEGRRAWNGNTYPTHSLGPVAQWLGINRDDRLTITTTWMSPSVAAPAYAARVFGPDSPAAQPGYFIGGDSATTLVQTERGHLIVLRRDSGSPRPHNMVHYALQGTQASYLSPRHSREDPLVWIEGRSPGTSPGSAEWESLWAYADEYEHPRWSERGEQARRAGHGGGDFFVLEDFVQAIRSGQPPTIDVYDAVTWSSLMPLSVESVRQGGAPVEVPNFRGRHA